MTTTSVKRPRRKRNGYIPIRNSSGKLLCRYNPRRKLLEFVRNGRRDIIDLTSYEPQKILRQRDLP